MERKDAIERIDESIEFAFIINNEHYSEEEKESEETIRLEEEKDYLNDMLEEKKMIR